MPGELVTDGERIGIQFRTYQGKTFIFHSHFSRTGAFGGIYPRICQGWKKLHSSPVPDGVFTDFKTSFKHMIKSEKCYTDAQKEKIHTYLDSLPDACTAMHGDFHIGNVIFTLPHGAPLSDPHDIFLIDL